MPWYMMHDTYTSIQIYTYLHPSQRKQMDLILLQFLYPWMTVYLYLSCQVYISSISAYLYTYQVYLHTCILDKRHAYLHTWQASCIPAYLTRQVPHHTWSSDCNRPAYLPWTGDSQILMNLSLQVYLFINKSSFSLYFERDNDTLLPLYIIIDKTFIDNWWLNTGLGLIWGILIEIDLVMMESILSCWNRHKSGDG